MSDKQELDDRAHFLILKDEDHTMVEIDKNAAVRILSKIVYVIY